MLLLDLNTSQGFEDDRGVAQRAVLTDGPLCFRCGRYAVYMIFSLPKTQGANLLATGTKIDLAGIAFSGSGGNGRGRSISTPSWTSGRCSARARRGT